ncbi:hypothetical protein AB1Y20_010476 [Prymnesium parvum]|uniref:Calmodulin n=1 Tax=Prymnesium parvum TaxID=97485 RepID=A0AB34INS2_PRYPA
MGCGASTKKPAAAEARQGSAPEKERPDSKQPLMSPKRLSVASKGEAIKKYVEHKNKRRTVADMDDEASKGVKMVDLEGLQQMWPEMEAESVKFLFNLFDKDGHGRIDTQEFVMAVALLTEDCKTTMQQLDACFHMFDTEKTGHLSRDEFEAMINASVTLSLHTVLSTEEGLHVIEEQLQKEYSEENINFWKQARAYVKASAEDRPALAKAIVDTFIADSAEFQINIPHGMRKGTLEAFRKAKESGEYPDNMFKDSEEEIFTLMDRDTWARVKADPKMTKSMASNYFTAADTNKDGIVSYEEYTTWALHTPQVLSFFGKLQQSVTHLMKDKV